MDKLTEAQTWVGVLIPTLLAAAGGGVRVIQGGSCSWKSLLVGVLTSAFTGVVVHLFISDLAISPSVKAGIVGVGGFASGDLLRVLADGVCKMAKAKVKGE